MLLREYIKVLGFLLFIAMIFLIQQGGKEGMFALQGDFITLTQFVMMNLLIVGVLYFSGEELNKFQIAISVFTLIVVGCFYILYTMTYVNTKTLFFVWLIFYGVILNFTWFMKEKPMYKIERKLCGWSRC